MLSITDLFDYKWDYAAKGSYLPKIASFSKQFVEKTISVVVSAKSKQEYYELISNLLEIIDSDVDAVKAGRLYVNNTYLRCFFIESQKSKRYVNTQRSVVELKLLVEDGNWLEENIISFGAITNPNYSKDGLDYAHDYPHDYTNSLVNRVIANPGYTPSNFIMRIYGACANPMICIDTNVYKVNASLITGEYIEIDSAERTIYKIMNNGTRVNLFDERDRENDIFAKIPDGVSAVIWGGGFGFDVTLLVKRSEPRWI